MRVKGGVQSRRLHNKYLKQAKGYRGGRSVLYRTAREAVEHGLVYAYRDRKARKREMRGLWIVRIGAGAKMLGTSYSKLIGALNKAEIALDRKMLADLAVSDFMAFTEVVKAAGISVTSVPVEAEAEAVNN